MQISNRKLLSTDTDGDGYSDMLEYSYFQSGRFDPNGNPYNPMFQNAPGDVGYMPTGEKETFWILMMPAILSGVPSL